MSGNEGIGYENASHCAILPINQSLAPGGTGTVLVALRQTMNLLICGIVATSQAHSVN
jgi:hypothetical protein